MKKLSCAAICLVLGMASSSQSLASTQFDGFRKSFTSAEIFPIWQIFNSKWNCKSATFQNPDDVFTGVHFSFHRTINDSLVYSPADPSIPWTPGWIAQHQGIRSSSTIHTNNWFTDPLCAGQNPTACGQRYKDPVNNPDMPIDMLMHSYFRKLNYDDLFIEWVSTNKTDSDWSSISKDTQELNTRAIMYSVCERAPQ